MYAGVTRDVNTFSLGLRNVRLSRRLLYGRPGLVVPEGLQTKVLMQIILQDDSTFITGFEHVMCNITSIR